MKQFEITISGDSPSSVEDALREVLRLIEAGYFAGANSNNQSEFSFSSEGEYEFD